MIVTYRFFFISKKTKISHFFVAFSGILTLYVPSDQIWPGLAQLNRARKPKR